MLDVDYDKVDSRASHLGLEPLAVAAPGRGVHREHRNLLVVRVTCHHSTVSTSPHIDPLLGLDPEQRAVAEALHGPVVVLAGAGTGKTRAITHRIAHGVLTGVHDPRRTLAVTFTARAAGELRERLRVLGVDGVSARTFHSAALRQLRFFWPRAVGGALPDILPTKARIVAEAASQCRVSTDQAMVRDLSSEIEWAKVSQITPERFAASAAAAGRDLPIDAAEIARIFTAYDEIKAKRGLIDFEDVLLLLVAILDSRRDVLEEVHQAYRWFTVDEYQDVSPLQQRLLDLWVGERQELCVVGDAVQTIYTFAGATPAHLLGFAARFPQATSVQLVRSYRSTPQIVALANSIVAAAQPPALPDGQQAPSDWRITLRPTRPEGPPPRVISFDDEVAEARGVAEEIAALITTGTSPREIAILFRLNAMSENFEEALAERGIPYVLRGGERFFERPEVREAMTRLRGAARADADADVTERVRAVLAEMSWSEQPPAGTGAVREKWESLSALATLTEDLAQTVGTLKEVIAELDLRAEIQHAPVTDGVTLASLHAAKGLEWDAVFCVGLVEGTMPIIHATTDARVEEERRLLYVGVTRARQHLCLSWSRARQPGGRGSRRPSRFLDDLVTTSGNASEGSVRKGTSRARPERSRRGPAACRQCGTALVTGSERTRGRCRNCPIDLNEAMLDRLKDWRLLEAKRRAVPAYVIFTDATLQAITEQQPSDPDDLLAISGIGPDKHSRYAECVLALVRGEDPPEPQDV